MVITCSMGFYWAWDSIEILGFTGFYRVLPGFTGFYRVLPSFTEFYRVLPSFTEFYRVLPSFPGVSRWKEKGERFRLREREREGVERFFCSRTRRKTFQNKLHPQRRLKGRERLRGRIRGRVKGRRRIGGGVKKGVASGGRWICKCVSVSVNKKRQKVP